MAKVKIGTEVQIMRPFKIFCQLNDGSYDACDAHGNCLKVNPNEINILTKNQSEMKAMKDAVLATAKQLCKANNTVTTLEIKTELRRDYPYYFWDQATVSNYMAQLAGDGIFNYTDNGTYRTYSLAKTPATKTISSAKTLNIVVTKSLGVSGSAGVVGTVGTKSKKKSKNVVTRNSVILFSCSPKFESVTLASGKVVDKHTIRGQKKSPEGYITPKLHNVTAITVNGITYQVQ